MRITRDDDTKFFIKLITQFYTKKNNRTNKNKINRQNHIMKKN